MVRLPSILEGGICTINFKTGQLPSILCRLYSCEDSAEVNVRPLENSCLRKDVVLREKGKGKVVG